MLKTCVLVTSILLSSISVHAQAPFYQGKTITIVQGRDPGGTGDLRVRALVPFLQKHIPGSPTIIMEFMPGGGSRKAANHVFRSARPDGLTIGNLSAGMVSLAILGESGGSTTSTSSTTWARPTALIIPSLSPAATPAGILSTNCALPLELKSADSLSASPPTTKAGCSATCWDSKSRCSSPPSAAPSSIRR